MTINFAKQWKPAIILSSILMITMIFVLFTKGLNLGTDFTGGSVIHYKFENPVKVSGVREAMNSINLGSATVQVVADRPDEVIITTEMLADEKVADTIAKVDVERALVETLGLNETPIVLQSSDIGPSVSSELQLKAYRAISLALLGILIYIWYRFELKFGIAALVALVHDCLFTLGIFAILGREINISMIAALLTIIGYSLNDTIVISDRIRENIRRFKKSEFANMVNTSINQSLTRTVNTSLTTLIPVTILFVYGGENLATFALALMIGVIVGTYSSLYIVAPTIVSWTAHQDRKIRKNG